MPQHLAPHLSPHGHLTLRRDEDAPAVQDPLAERLLDAFADGAGPGLLHLGAAEVGQAMPPALAWWRDFAGLFVTRLCHQPAHSSDAQTLPPPAAPDIQELLTRAPLMQGAEYLDAGILEALWEQLATAFSRHLSEHDGDLQQTLHQYSPAWNVVGRVHLNLAENRRDPEHPFAFLATWTPRLSAHGTARHQPLARALKALGQDRQRLLSLLVPVQRAAAACPWLKELVDSGEIFHPLRWTPDEAMRLLRDVPELEQAGVVVRLPKGWAGGRPRRPKVTVTVGDDPPTSLGIGALLDVDLSVCLDGEPLSQSELDALLEGSRGLALLRGQWVEVDPERLQREMDRFTEIQEIAQTRGLSFAEASRLLTGAAIGAGPGEERDAAWSEVVGGGWFRKLLADLRDPDELEGLLPVDGLRATLRHYQQTGVRWLHLVTGLGLGACLADDMGLGKTIQLLALLLVLKRDGVGADSPSLLVAPASLLANWAAEAQRFAPSLRIFVAHPSVTPREELRQLDADALRRWDLVVTSYGLVRGHDWPDRIAWDIVALDEAQAIKNPQTARTRAVKQLRARARVALTGTPVENRLGDLWSLFDFLNPGLLGNATAFRRYARKLQSGEIADFGALRSLVRPYILRRLKTDPGVAPDLPDKTEVQAWCSLSRRQAALYTQAVADLEEALSDSDSEGMERRGLVLASLMRFKQICNHPSQWLGDEEWAPRDSGKWRRLRELCETIAARQDKVLIFTQFRQIIEPLRAFLGEVFGRPGLTLHGGTSVGKRQDLVQRFQDDEGIPFFILSLKAGGSGLNLTAASHVVHFDRWWNPAVEDQATDRAYRIGQRSNVLVHKFTCRGTVEERIDEIIRGKRKLSRELLDVGEQVDLTSLDDAELLDLVTLDLEAATSQL